MESTHYIPQACVVLQDVVTAKIIEVEGRGVGRRVRGHSEVEQELAESLVDV